MDLRNGTGPDNGKINVLLVGHVLGEKVFGSERSLLELIQLIDRDRFNIFCSFPQAGGALLETIKSFLAGCGGVSLQMVARLGKQHRMASNASLKR